MKYKSIFSIALAASIIVGVSSCEDMLSTDSTVVAFEEDNKLNQPTDTVYSLLGVIQKLQVIADRTILLGELRGDLAATTMYASADLKELNSFDFSNDNEYNEVADYYAVINNCNYFLSHADTTFTVGGKKIFQKEYIAILSYRAWTYLQLAQAYGKVPFVDEPITSGDEAKISNYPLLDIREIATRLIPSLENCLGDNIDADFPSIGELSVGSTKYNSKKFYIPVRLILGDLYLWAGGKENAGKAAVCYTDYLIWGQKRISTGTSGVRWSSKDYIGNINYITGNYASNFSTEQNGRDNNQICYIPMEQEKYKGVISDLMNVFNSTKDNDYYYQVTASKAMFKISSDQVYSYFYHRAPQETTDSRDTLYILDKTTTPGGDRDFDKNDISSQYSKGDLRLSEVIGVTARNSDYLNQSKESQSMIKIKSDRICLYRNDVVYLRLAEALNRAELPEMAFAILKYGLCNNVLSMNVNYDELLRANDIDPILISFPSTYFSPAKLTYSNGKYDSYSAGTDNVPANTIGLHSRGSGDASSNKYYVIPASANLKDSVKAVEEMILDEMALETCFEGYRFGDLLRISMHRVESESGAFADNEFLATKLSVRDASLYSKLNNGGSNEYNSSIFLPLP